MKKQTGLTFTDTIIALAIAGILTALTVPAYRYYLNQSELNTIKAKLLELQNEQHAFRLKNEEYLKLQTIQLGREGHEYRIESENVSSNTFRLVATSESGKPGCETLTIDENFNKTPEACWH